MDGLGIKVKVEGGDEKTYALRPRTIVGFEQKYGKGLSKLLSEDQKVEHIYWLAWDSMRLAGVIVKPFGDSFLDTLLHAELVSDISFESTETV